MFAAMDSMPEFGGATTDTVSSPPVSLVEFETAGRTWHAGALRTQQGVPAVPVVVRDVTPFQRNVLPVHRVQNTGLDDAACIF